MVGLTSHTYLNLDGDGAGSVNEHLLQVPAEDYLPTDADGIPLEVAPVAGTSLRPPRAPVRWARRSRGSTTATSLAGSGLRVAADARRPRPAHPDGPLHRPARGAGLHGPRVRRVGPFERRARRTRRVPASPSSRSCCRTPRTGPTSAPPCCAGDLRARSYRFARQTEWRARQPDRVHDRDPWNNTSWAGPDVRSRWSVSAPGSWAPTGARSRSPTPARCSRPRRRRASPSTTPPTSTATAAASRSSAASSPTTPTTGSRWPPRWAAGSTSCPRTTTPTTSAPGSTGRGSNLGVDRLDLVQLHCPPSATIDDDATYDALDALVEDGSIAAYGVSVETVDQALSCDDAAAPRDRADHPQRAAAQAARAGAADRDRDRRRHHRAGAAGLRSALGEVRRSTRRSPRTTTATTTATAVPSTSARPSPASRTTWGCQAAAEFTALVRESGPEGLTAGAGRDRLGLAAARCQHRDPGRAQRASRPGPTRPPELRPPSARTSSRAWVGSTTQRVRELVHDRW